MGNGASFNCLRTNTLKNEEMRLDTDVLFLTAKEQESMDNQNIQKRLLEKTQAVNEYCDEVEFKASSVAQVEQEFDEIKIDSFKFEDQMNRPNKVVKPEKIIKEKNKKVGLIPFELVPEHLCQSYSIGEIIVRSKLPAVDFSELIEGVKFPIDYFHRLYDGSVYRGEFDEKFRLHGRGFRFFPDNSIYIGKFFGGHAKGEGKYLTPEKVLIEGNFVSVDEGVSTYNGTSLVVQGYGSESWPDGTTYLGYFHMGEKEGQGTLTHNGCIYEGEFYNGLFNGAGKMAYANGDVYEGNWRDSLKHGKGELRQKNGKIYKGFYKNNEKFGEGVMIWPDRRRYEGKWKSGKMHGMGTYSFFDKNKGRLRTGISEWKEGERVRWVSPSRENIAS